MIIEVRTFIQTNMKIMRNLLFFFNVMSALRTLDGSIISLDLDTVWHAPQCFICHNL